METINDVHVTSLSKAFKVCLSPEGTIVIAQSKLPQHDSVSLFVKEK